jgi:hypothetical protein
MSERSIPTSQTTKVVADAGRLRNEHFLLTADHLLLEVDPESFDLVSAIAEGNIHVHMTVPHPYGEYVIYAQSAVFQPYYQRLNLNGPIGTRINGVEYPSAPIVGEVRIPTDGSFALPPQASEKEKWLPSRFKGLKRLLGSWFEQAPEPCSAQGWPLDHSTF